MTRIIFDDWLRSQINGEAKAREIVDASGTLLGYFLPPGLYADYHATWEKEEADLDELDRISLEKEEGTLSELWKELGVE